MRVERASQDHYKDGGALAEVLSTFDKSGDSVSNDSPQGENVELMGKTKCQLAIEVRFYLCLFMRYMLTMLSFIETNKSSNQE